MKISWKAAMLFVAGGLLLGSVVSVAAQSPSPIPAPLQAPGDGPKVWGGGGLRGPHGLHGGPGGHPIRSEAVFPGVDGGAVRTIRTDRGDLKAVDGNTLTIEEEDGTSVKVTVGDATRISRDGAEAKLADLKTGDEVITHREKTGDAAFTTTFVKAISAERQAQIEQQRAACESDPSQCPRGPGRGGPFGGRGPGGPGEPGLPVPSVAPTSA